MQHGKNTKNYKIINFQKFSGASNKIATAGLLRATEPWRFLRIIQIDINWISQKQIPHQFILSEIFQKVWLGGGGGVGSFTPEVEKGLRVSILIFAVNIP